MVYEKVRKSFFNVYFSPLTNYKRAQKLSRGKQQKQNWLEGNKEGFWHIESRGQELKDKKLKT